MMGVCDELMLTMTRFIVRHRPNDSGLRARIMPPKVAFAIEELGSPRRPLRSQPRPPPQPRPAYPAGQSHAAFIGVNEPPRASAAAAAALPFRPEQLRSAFKPAGPSTEARAFKPLYDALDEDAWLETKFERSGAPQPAEGDLTVVIEYCFNSGDPETQVSTKHNEDRFHEEAELVRQYLLNYYPGTVVSIIASDFRQRALAPPGTRVRLGAFEIDARLRVDGRLISFSLWSKLHTGKWPVWPDWQDGVRQMVPVFHLNLRPCALRSDGSSHFLPDARVVVLNHDGSRVVVDERVGERGGEARRHGGLSQSQRREAAEAPGVPVRLLRGTYTVRVPMRAGEDFFAEEALLSLTRVPLPRGAGGAGGAVELLVPLAAKPRLRVVVHAAMDPQGELQLEHCAARLSDVRLSVVDRSPRHDGEVLFDGVAADVTAPIYDIHGAACGVVTDVDLMPYIDRIPQRRSDLADSLWGLLTGADGRPELEQLEQSALPPPPGQAWAAPTADGVSGFLASSAAGSSSAAAAAVGMHGGMGSSSSGAVAEAAMRQAEESTWMVGVTASLFGYASVPLDMTLSSQLVNLGRGGASDVTLRLARRTRQVHVLVSSSDALTSPWAAALPIADVPIEVVHARTNALVSRAVAVGDPLAVLAAERDRERLSDAQALVQAPRGGLAVQRAMATLDLGLAVNESFQVKVVPPADGERAPAYRAASASVVVLAGDEPMEVHVYTERLCSDLTVRWFVSELAPAHWANALPLPDGFGFVLRHRLTKARVLSAHYSRGGHARAALLSASRADPFAEAEKRQEAAQRKQQAAAHVAESRRAAAEAYERIKAFMVDSDVEFNGAGEQGLSSIEQAWSIDNTEPSVAAANRQTLRGVAAILHDYPAMRCEVHGETGKVQTAPQALADHLGMHPVDDRHLCMEALAQHRAQACLEALVREGVPREQLRVTAKGEGGALKVDFIPEGYELEDALADDDAHGSQATGSPAAAPAAELATGGAALAPAYDEGPAARETSVSGAGALFVGEAYLLELAEGAGVLAEPLSFDVKSTAPTLVDVTLRRANAPVQVRIRPAVAGGSAHWTSGVGLPPGIAFVIDHVGSGERVAAGHTDGNGEAYVPPHDTLFVGEQYSLRVADSTAVLGGSVDFTLSAPASASNALFASVGRADEEPADAANPLHALLGAPPSSRPPAALVDLATLPPADAARACVAELFLERATVETNILLQASGALGSEHWGAALAPPPVSLRVVHLQTKGFVCAATTNHHGLAHLVQSHGLFLGETYTVEAAGGADGARLQSVHFTARPPAPDPATGVLVPQLVLMPFDRATNDVTLAVKVRAESQRVATSATLAAPSGLRYSITHKTLNKEVATGVTDQVGKSVLKRKGTLFVGETYVVRTASGPGISAGETTFTVEGDNKGFEVSVEVSRACSSLSFALKPLLADTQHWAHSLPLPDGIRYEIVHCESRAVVHAGTTADRKGSVDGERVGLYVGERYWLRVPATELLDESSLEFSPEEGGVTSKVLRVGRAFSSVDVVLRSVHAGTSHWAAGLPLPSGVPLKVQHAVLKCLVASGTTDAHSRASFPARTQSFVAGEPYEVVVDATDTCYAHGGETPFTPTSRNAEVACRVRRCVGPVTVCAKYAKAGSGHWSSALPMPDGIAFNVYHKRLGKPVAHGATRRDKHDSADVSVGGRGDGHNDALLVGETYTLEVPATVQLKMAKKDFTVTSEAQVVHVALERRVGRVMVHLLPGEADLPPPTNVTLHLKHRGLDQRVMPAFPIGADRAELHGDGTLLVGETYELSAVANGAILPSSTDFLVTDAEVVQVHLPLERATAEVSLVFRAQPPPAISGGSGKRLATASHLATSLELPEGLVYEVRHKTTNRVVATGATKRRDVAPRVALAPGYLFVGETYVLKVLAGFGLHGGSCEFYVRTAEAQEVTLQVRRATCGISLAFRALEVSTDHWAAALPLPRNVPFKVIHKASGAVVHEADGGPTNKVSLPPDLLFTGETYILQSLSSQHILASRCEFVVTGSSSGQSASVVPGSGGGGGGSGVHYGGDSQEVALAIDRAVGDVRLVMRSADGRPLPVGVPFSVSHAGLGCVVIEGRTSLSGMEVECDAWFVNQGALYVGEQYSFAVPKGNGFRAAEPQLFVVGEKTPSQRKLERTEQGRLERASGQGGASSAAASGTAVAKEAGGAAVTTVVELELSRELAQASVQLLSDKAGTAHWSEALALPANLAIYVRLAHDGRFVVGKKLLELDGQATQTHVNLTEEGNGVEILAHQRYTLELQQTAQVLRSTAELQVGSGSQTASAALYVSRACVPALVVVLRSADEVTALPVGLRVRVHHTSLACLVAESVTTQSDTSVRCLLHVPDAFYVGEHYTATVESNFGVGGAVAAFEVIETMAEPVELVCSRATSDVQARLFPLLPKPNHWSRALNLPPQQLEVLHNSRVLASTSLAWARGATDLRQSISKMVDIFVGHTYTLRVLESPSVQGLSVPLVAEEGAQQINLPLRRRFFSALVTVKSKQELPLPYGIAVQIRHKDTMTLVAAGKAGEAEGQSYESEVASAHSEQKRTEAEKQAGAALKRVAAFLADGNDIYFNGAGEAGLPIVEQAWSVNHLDRRYKAQNWKTIDGIAAILREFDQIALEVHGETGPADHAPPMLASHFGLERTKDVQRLMDRLAELRAEACRQALILRGVAADRLFVSFKGRGGHIRTDFIPRSLHDASSLALSVTQILKPQSRAGAIGFHSAAERYLQSVSLAWSLDHTDAAIRMQNRAALETVASTMLRYPMLHLEVCVSVETQSGGAAPKRLLEHFPAAGRTGSGSGGTLVLQGEPRGAKQAAISPAAEHSADEHSAEAVRNIFQRYDSDKSGDIDARELRTALQGMGLPTDGAQAAAVLAKYDRDHTGGLELEEFSRLVSELSRFQQSRAGAAPDAIGNVFRQYDVDHSGAIEPTELRAALAGMGLDTSSAQAAQVLAKYDADGSGRLEEFEFRTLVNELRRFQQEQQSGGTAAAAGAMVAAANASGGGQSASAALSAHAAFDQLARARRRRPGCTAAAGRAARARLRLCARGRRGGRGHLHRAHGGVAQGGRQGRDARQRRRRQGGARQQGLPRPRSDGRAELRGGAAADGRERAHRRRRRALPWRDVHRGDGRDALAWRAARQSRVPNARARRVARAQD